jgi:NAD(P)-dependent dehydrogenase (short-subunit alcohol dehydrogenase family)
MESVMLTNVYGHVCLAAELMPLLRATPAARIVTQSSGARFQVAAGAEAIIHAPLYIPCMILHTKQTWEGGWGETDFTTRGYHQAIPAKVHDLDGTDEATFSNWDQYCLSKAACVLFTQALNDRLASTPGSDHITCLATDPGLTSTGVNIQHQLTHSIPGLSGRLANTNEMHDKMGHHAADGALAMALAAVVVAPVRNDFYTADATRRGPPPGATSHG